MWQGTIWYGNVWYGMVYYGMVWYGMVWYITIWYGMVYYGMVWYITVWYGILRYGMVWYITVWYITVWYGILRYGMVWYTVKWYGTHAKISHLVASLPTSRQQVVFALLVPSCQQIWNKLLTTCNNFDSIGVVARLFQQVRYSYDVTMSLQRCVVNLVTFLLYDDFIRLVRTTLLQVNAIRLVASC